MTSTYTPMSVMLPESPPCPTVLHSHIVAGDLQYLEQLSTLFVPTTPRASFCIRYDSSFVHLDEEMKASLSGFSSILSLNLDSMMSSRSEEHTSELQSRFDIV